MTIREAKNIAKIVDLVLDESITANSRMKLHKRLDELSKLAIQALEQQPSEAYISREEVINLINHSLCDLRSAWGKQTFINTINSLPPVTPQRPKGKWLDDCGGVKCSCCGYYIDDYYYCKNYCTNCGAKMEVEE